MDIENMVRRLKEQQAVLSPDFFDDRIRRRYWHERHRHMDRRKAIALVVLVLLLDVGVLVMNQLRQGDTKHSRFYELYVPGDL